MEDFPNTIYWDTEGSQKNGMSADGPWPFWAGWNGENAWDFANNYNYIVTYDGRVYGKGFYEGERRISPTFAENIHGTTSGNTITIKKDGSYLINCCLIREDSSIFISGINRQTDGSYIVVIEGANNSEIDLYAVWQRDSSNQPYQTSESSTKF